MRVHRSAILHLALIKAMRSFTMRRLMIFVGFSLVGVVLGFCNAMVLDREVVMAVFALAGFIASLAIEDRKDVRFPVLMHAVYAYRNSTAGEGVVENVSMGGCKVRSTTPATSGAELRLQFYPPGEAPPIEIEKARVRWTAEGQFGVQFIEMEQKHKERLGHLINQLPEQVPDRPVAAA